MRLGCRSAALALVGTVVVGAGCGSGTSGPDSHAEYQRHLTPVARDINAVLNGFQQLATASLVYPAKPDAAKKARAKVEGMRSTLRTAATRLDDVTPPPAVSGDHTRLTRATRTLADELSPVIAKLKVGSLVSVVKVTRLPATPQVHGALRAIAAKGYRLPSSSP